jgi:hypothetical protein
MTSFQGQTGLSAVLRPDGFTASITGIFPPAHMKLGVSKRSINGVGIPDLFNSPPGLHDLHGCCMVIALGALQ